MSDIDTFAKHVEAFGGALEQKNASLRWAVERIATLTDELAAVKAKLAEAVGLLDECRPYLRDAASTYGNCGKEDVSELLDEIAKAREVMG